MREGLLCLYSGEAYHRLGRNIFYAGVDFPMVKKMVPVFFPRGKFYIISGAGVLNPRVAEGVSKAAICLNTKCCPFTQCTGV